MARLGSLSSSYTYARSIHSDNELVGLPVSAGLQRGATIKVRCKPYHPSLKAG
jgi:hypothetical protein